MDQLVKQVSDMVHSSIIVTAVNINYNQCTDESCQKDLCAYLERIQLCCHQLKISSAVIADLGASVKEKVT